MNERFNDGLDRGQGMALLAEAQSSSNLLRDGVEAILKLRHPQNQGDTVFTLASIGVEKLMKIVLGLNYLRQGGGWPAVGVMQEWGHGVSGMDVLVSSTLQDNLVLSTHQPYVDSLFQAHRQDQHWPLFLEVLNRYGQAGRFHNLNHLARGKPDQLEPPSEFWNRLERSIIIAQPEILTMLAGDNQASENGYAALSRITAVSLDNWWFMIHRAAIHGCFGERGTFIGWEIWPHGRQSLVP